MSPRLALPLLAALLLGACATPPSPPPEPPPVVVPAPVEAPPPPPVEPAPPPAPEAPPAAVPIDPLRPEVRIDPEDQTTRIDLWMRLRGGFKLTDLEGDLVRKWEQWYAARPDYVQRMTERGGRYLFHILEELDKRGMPSELALLPFIESAYNPEAMSHAKASGMWQFVPATGRDFDLRQNVFRDDRRGVLASTRAALDYLQVLHGMFGDWQLALAAYNWGQGSVQRAQTRNQKAGLPTDYLSLRMPDETRNYLPKLQAVKNIVMRPDAFALTLPSLQNHPYFLSVPIERDIDVELAARLAALPLDEFRQLNPQMNKPVILAAGTPLLLLPYDSANTFVRALAEHRGKLASWTAWVAPKTLKPVEAARQVGMDETQLRNVNHIPSGMLVKAGSTLLVPRDAKRPLDVTEDLAHNAMLALAPDRPPLRRVSFKAGKKGDSVAAVARRYRLAPAQVAAWNDVNTQAMFKPGQAIVVMLAGSSSSAKAVRTAVAAKTAPAVVKPLRTVAKPGSTTGRRIARPAPTARTRQP
ncbi:transglycosylase SLT domain-containing protein [Aquincola sp. S2]|uniref:Transglycosylase SLT domain-containing protein n=1 Tax=Pseudaquabacterium terrae TaxID=2732868 RepID=A0ABX2EMN5_9BURK|nr:transglycosylase SLT domain-containing protein [Aquabacterium terrae]NRF69932.1 transglycosylase SLT domain-containing protein [Aquabacterium terrae]